MPDDGFPPDSDDSDDFDPEEAVVLPIEDELDLHTFRPGEVKEVLEAYLEAAADKGFDEVRIIHGKGKGVLRAGVEKYLARNPHVASFKTASPDRGGWGAAVVRLKKKKP